MHTEVGNRRHGAIGKNMRRSQLLLLGLPILLAGLLGLACGSGEVDLPDANGAEVWTYFQEIDYRQNWDLWPGKGELYTGGEPHGALFTTYLNRPALEALNNKAGSMPNGAIIIKENYTADAVFDLVTVMYKVEGFDPENNDWFWAKIGAGGDVQAAGRVMGCQACHGASRANDFVLTAPLK